MESYFSVFVLIYVTLKATEFLWKMGMYARRDLAEILGEILAKLVLSWRVFGRQDLFLGKNLGEIPLRISASFWTPRFASWRESRFLAAEICFLVRISARSR